MYVPPTGSSQGTTGSEQKVPGLNRDDFLKLLLAELKAQDPLSPMDTNTMTTQITLLNVLQELIEIKTMLQNLLSAKAQEGAEPSTNNGAEEVAGDGS
ncbi:MAG TPA: flagellar biosynthesis protein FlgD [Coprothermobacter sp.]|nr:flagellar biosynthesis protein FlgD [Coprothermobacter sp.]